MTPRLSTFRYDSLYYVLSIGTVLMVVYSSVKVPGTEFISLNGPLPTCLNATENHVVGLNMIMRPAVIESGGEFF